MRAKNMQSLTNDIKKKRPGVIIYGIGDDEHKRRVSDHNEDDTPGVRTPQTDADNDPEHRAIDVMVGPKFSKADMNLLVKGLVEDPKARVRLFNIIWNGYLWSKNNNWVKVKLDPDDDQHEDHGHIAGRAADDPNDAPWPAVTILNNPSAGTPNTDAKLIVDGELGPKTIAKWQKVMGTPVDGEIDAKDSDLVRAVQTRLKATVDHRLEVDGQGIHQDGKRSKTIGALQRYLKTPVDLFLSVPKSRTVEALQRRLNDNKF